MHRRGHEEAALQGRLLQSDECRGVSLDQGLRRDGGSQSGLGLLGHGRERLGVAHGELGEGLAVQLNARR